MNILSPASSFVLPDLWYFEHKHIRQCTYRDWHNGSVMGTDSFLCCMKQM